MGYGICPIKPRPVTPKARPYIFELIKVHVHSPWSFSKLQTLCSFDISPQDMGLELALLLLILVPSVILLI